MLQLPHFYVLQQIQVCPEEESLLTTSFVNSLAHLQSKEGKDNVEYDFQALRLDWFRFQALTSVNKAALRSEYSTPNFMFHDLFMQPKGL